MVERRGADPTLADNDGKNALHLLCQYNALPQEPALDAFNPSDPFNEEPKKDESKAKEDYARKWKEQRELLRELLKFLLDKGVPTLAADKEGYIPLAYALEASYDVGARPGQATTYRKYYDNLALILNKMEEEADKLSGFPSDVKKPNVLHVFCRNVSLVAIDAERFVYESLARVVKKWRPLSSLGGLDTVVDGSSSFFGLCRRYAEVADLKETGVQFNRHLELWCQSAPSSWTTSVLRHFQNFKHDSDRLNCAPDFRGSVAKDVVFSDLEWEREGGDCGLLGMEDSMEQFRGAIHEFYRHFRFRVVFRDQFWVLQGTSS